MAAERMTFDEERAFFGELDLTRPELSAVRQAVEAHDWRAAKEAWATHLKERTSPTWMWSHRDRQQIQAFLKEHGDDLSKQVESADKVMRREFRILGVTRTLEKDFKWVGYEKEWGNVLNRHHYWKSLGLAWWKTGDDKYAEDWVLMLCDWIKDNPPEQVARGPWRSLETGGRPAVWLDVMSMFMDAPAFDAETKYLFTRSIRDHAANLYLVNQKWRGGNWGQTHAVGLACIGIMFPEFKQAAAWRTQALPLVGKHMKSSVFPDGAHCELTPGYHYWMTLSFMDIMKLAQKNGYDIPGLNERHVKMFEFLMQVAKPNRWFVPLGDAGCGKPIEGIMGLGALLYNRPDMRYLARDTVDPDWIWTFSPEALAAYGKMKKEVPSMGSQMMPHARYGVMRTGWKTDDRFLLFDCAPWGGGHSHQDRLQVVLYSGRDLLLDSGQSSYDNPLSKTYFKKSKAHNVLLIDEQEQPGSNPEVLSWNIEDRVEFTSGRIKDKKMTHQRSVLFVKPDYWVVVDHVAGKGEHTLTRLFHFPDVTVRNGLKTAQTQYKDGDNLWIGCADDARIEMREGWFRKSYPEMPKTPVAAYVTKQALPAALCTVLVPFGKEDDIPKVEQLMSADPNQVAIKVSFKDGRTDWIAVAPKVMALKAGEHSGTGVALCARRGKQAPTLDLVQPKALAVEKKKK